MILLTKYFQKIISYLLPILRMQIFITLVALPILVYWGLAISTLTIIGNIVFAPLLLIFLLVSSFIFFTQILLIPNNWLICILEKTTALWLKISVSCPQKYLLAFAQNSWLIFVLGLFLGTYLIMYYQKNIFKQVFSLSFVLLISIVLAKQSCWIGKKQLTIKHRKQKMELSYQDDLVIIHDYGILCQKYGVTNLICYKLLPALIKNFGQLKIDELHIHKNSHFNDPNLNILKNSLEIKLIKYY